MKRALVLLSAVMLALGGPALAAPPAGPDPTAQAKIHFRKGTEFYKEARYREAIAEFQAAYRLRPHGVIFYNLAQCHERLGDIPAALQAYHEYLRQVPRAEDRKTVEAAMANLEARLGASGVQQLLIYSDPSGAEVLVDGHSRGRTPLALVLPQGSYQVSLVKEGHRTATRQAVLTPNRSLEMDVAMQRLAAGERAAPPPVAADALPRPGQPIPLPPSPAGTAASAAPTPARAPATATAPPPPPPKRERPRLWTWVAAGASAAALAAGAGFYMSARSAQSDLRGSYHDTAAADRLTAQVKSRQKTANALYLAGAGLGAGAGVLFFVEGSF